MSSERPSLHAERRLFVTLIRVSNTLNGKRITNVNKYISCNRRCWFYCWTWLQIRIHWFTNLFFFITRHTGPHCAPSQDVLGAWLSHEQLFKIHLFLFLSLVDFLPSIFFSNEVDEQDHEMIITWNIVSYVHITFVFNIPWHTSARRHLVRRPLD